MSEVSDNQGVLLIGIGCDREGRGILSDWISGQGHGRVVYCDQVFDAAATIVREPSGVRLAAVLWGRLIGTFEREFIAWMGKQGMPLGVVVPKEETGRIDGQDWPDNVKKILPDQIPAWIETKGLVPERMEMKRSNHDSLANAVPAGEAVELTQDELDSLMR